jgi:succinyl-diaminopimelate desuccinylase
MGNAASIDRVVSAVDAAADEIVAFAADLIRVPTVNPPGDAYPECARLIGDRLEAFGFEVDYFPADGAAEHTPTHPRVNVVGLRAGARPRPCVHINGHMDVVPPGAGWTLDPFGGLVRDGKLYGRGACDMKAGLAAGVYAAEALRRAGIALVGTIEISATVDEESGGFAGVAWLARSRRITAGRQDVVIIPEPLNVDRVGVGHRGVYWFEITTRGRTGHGSMPFLGVNAIDQMAMILERIRRELLPSLASRITEVPVVPAPARCATLNINGISGGQPVDGIQTPCVADMCRVVCDRRFLLEEGFDAAKAEIQAMLTRAARDIPNLDYELRDLMVVHPVRTPDDSPVIPTIACNIERVLGRSASLVASPGTYDHKHIDRIAGIPHCVAYGPGILDLAHQPDEWCAVEDVIAATKVLALSILDLTGG